VVKHKEIGRRDIFTKNIMKKAQNDIDFIPSIMNHTISDAQKYSSLFGCHQEFLLDNLRRGRPFSHEGEFEVSDNLVDNFMIFYEGDD